MKYTKPKAEVVKIEVEPILLRSTDWDLLPEVTIPPNFDFFDLYS